MGVRQAVGRLKGEFSFIRGNVLVLVASQVLMQFSMPIPETYYSLFVMELGATPFTVGLIGFASFVALALVQFPGGYLADKYGRRELVVAMTFGAGLANILFALAPSWHFALIGAVIFNLCLIYQPALLAIMADSLPPEKRGIGFSIMQITGVVSIVSPLVASLLSSNFGLVTGTRVAYLLAFTAFFLAGVVRVRLRETINIDARRVGLIDVVRSYPAAFKESIAVWGLIPRTMLYLFLIFLATGFFAQMCYPYYIVYATKVLSIGELRWATLLALQSAIAFGSLLPIGKIVDVFGRKKPLVMIHLLSMLAMPFFIYGDFAKLIVFFLLSGIGNSMFVAYQSLEADLVPREYRGKVIGFTQFFTYISASIGQLLGGFLYEKVSPQMPFLLLLASTVPGAILTILLVHEPKKKEV
jgi:MFS family permease